jgi:PEP-CTERM motif
MSHIYVVFGKTIFGGKEMLSKKVLFYSCFILVFWNCNSMAVTLTLDGYDGLTFQGSMRHENQGGGHLICSDYRINALLIFPDLGTYVNDFEMNYLPNPDPNREGNGDLLRIEALDAFNTRLWLTTVNLSEYKSWDNWFLVVVETANVAKLLFSTDQYGSRFCPSIDNIRINESFTVPEPSTIILLGLGLLMLVRRSRQIHIHINKGGFDQ